MIKHVNQNIFSNASHMPLHPKFEESKKIHRLPVYGTKKTSINTRITNINAKLMRRTGKRSIVPQFLGSGIK